jgi:hypothetical protein
LLDSVNTSQPDLNASTKALLSSDYELNGTINRAASEGAKFALMVDATKEIDQIAEVTSDLNYYRSNPLSANDAYWQTCQHTSQLIYSGQLHSAQLWLAMHPEPLSQYNKPDAINEDVIANCSVNTQTRMQQAKEKVINIDETGLYDILQELEPISTQAIYNVS